MRSWITGTAIFAAGFGFAVCVAGPAAAMDSCSGMYSATLLHPLTEPTIVALDLADSSDVSKHLAEAFTNGLQEAGTTVAGTPTVKLRLSYQIIGQGGSGIGGGGGLNQGGGAQTGWTSWSGGDAAALQGGQTAGAAGHSQFRCVLTEAAGAVGTPGRAVRGSQCRRRGTRLGGIATMHHARYRQQDAGLPTWSPGWRSNWQTAQQCASINSPRRVSAEPDLLTCRGTVVIPPAQLCDAVAGGDR